MTVKTSFTKLFWRVAGAIAATLVTTFVAMFPSPAEAQARDCSLQDVAVWQSQLSDPQEELTPARIFEITTAFIEACPLRPEVREASRIAGMAAVDMGEGAQAVTYFEQAGYLRDDTSRLYFAAALLSDGQNDAAWDMRDHIIADWKQQMDRRQDVKIASRAVSGGTIYTVRFEYPDTETGIRAAWMAVPDAGGWPATLSLGSERQLTAFHRMRAGAETPALRHVDLYRCRSRRLLAKADKDIPVADLDAAASAALVAYLGQPDLLDKTAEGSALATCLWPNRLFPRPAR